MHTLRFLIFQRKKLDKYHIRKQRRRLKQTFANMQSYLIDKINYERKHTCSHTIRCALMCGHGREKTYLAGVLINNDIYFGHGRNYTACAIFCKLDACYVVLCKVYIIFFCLTCIFCMSNANEQYVKWDL